MIPMTASASAKRLPKVKRGLSAARAWRVSAQGWTRHATTFVRVGRSGRVIADKDVDGWLDLFVRGEPLPMPDAPPPPHAGQPCSALARRCRTIARGAGSGGARYLAALGAAIWDRRNHWFRWSNGGHAGVRERSTGSHRIIYEVVSDTGDDATAGDVTMLRALGPS